MLKSFLQHPVGDTSPEYRCAFIGMLHDLTKFEFSKVPVFGLTRQIPVASCIWLAIDKSMLHKLQSVFCYRKSSGSKDELHERRLPHQKADARSDATEKFLARTIPVNIDGSYDIKRIEEIVNGVKELFQVSASY